MFKIICLALLVSCVKAQVSPTTASGSRAPRGPYRPGQLIFEDNFNKLDLETWQHEQTFTGGGNGDFQWYTNNRLNSYVDDGKLHIAPTLVADEFGEDFLSNSTVNLWGSTPADTCTNNRNSGCEKTGDANNYINPIKSASIRTLNSFAFQYGIVEIKAKLPAGDWLWPAIKLLPKYDEYSSWPRSGEIDLIESRGNRQLLNGGNINVGVNQFTTSLHLGPDAEHDGYDFFNYATRAETGYDQEFHIYRLGWNDEAIEFAIDNTVIQRIATNETAGFWELGFFELFAPGKNPWTRGSRMAPFDQQFYINMNLAVGGTNGYFDDNHRNGFGSKPWNNRSPTPIKDFYDGRTDWLPTWNIGGGDSSHLQVEYVRVYAV